MSCIPALVLKKVTALNFTDNFTELNHPPHISQRFLFESSFVGRIDYEAAYRMQENLWQLAKNKNQFSILGLEHPTVITLGRRARGSNEVLSIAQSIPVVHSTRGGLATLHSEGQLVIYPIMDLRKVGLGVKDYVEQLLRITQKTFADFDVPAELDTDRIGLYTTQGKIAFCGLEIRQGVSLHGISMNIQNDISLFECIRSCGVKKMSTDVLKNYRSDVNAEQFFRAWIENFRINTTFQLS